MLRRCRLLPAVVACVVAACAVVAVAPSGAGASTHAKAVKTSKHKKHKKKPAKPPKPVTIAPGVVVRYYNTKITPKRVVRTALLRLDMRNRHVRLDASVPRGAIGAGRQTITAQTRALRAVGGINADFFDIREPGGAPLGGVVVNGVLVKSPRKNWDANFYVRGGRAHIGPLGFSATVTRAERPAPLLPLGSQPTPATTRVVSAVNSVRDLRSDRIVLLTSVLAVPKFGRGCTAVRASPGSTGSTGSTGYTVTSVVTGTRSIGRLTGRNVALVACGTGARARWLTDAIATGDALSVATAIAGGTPSTLVSGGQVLVRNGRAFSDTDGKRITGRNPETFGCVSQGGTKVVLGTIDGRKEGSSGVTLPELRRYLLRLHCRDALVFDGGGSSTLVGRAVGATTVRVLNRPSDRTGARAVTTGLVLHRR